MHRTRSLLALALTLALVPACSKKDKAKDKGGEPAASDSKAGASDETAADDKPEAAAVTTAWEAAVTGGSEGTFHGKMALVYDSAGFGHISLNAADRSMVIDFNSKNDKRPTPGEISLVSSNLKGWMGNVDIETDDGTAVYISSGGTLSIDSVDRGIYQGTFEFEAAPDSGAGGAIQVSGGFIAREK